MARAYDGTLIARGEDGYEAARRATVWNALMPERYPELIVRAESEEQVVRAVHHARERDMRIGVRSGGHSWADVLEQVFYWASEIGPRVARVMELMVFIHRTEAGELEIAVTGPVLADSDEQAREAIEVLESCPVLDQAKLALPYVLGELADLYAGAHAAYPDGYRYSADNMWTRASVDDLLPGLRRIAETLPPAPSHMLWMNWQPGATPQPERPDMAYSVEDDTYIALYGVWQDPDEDAANVAWAIGAPLLNTSFVRRRALPERLPRALAHHCAQEYANLGALLPELYERFGPGGPTA